MYNSDWWKYWQIAWLINWFTDKSIYWLTDCLIDWSLDCVVYLRNPCDGEGDSLGGLHVLAHGVQGHHLQGQSRQGDR